MKKIKMQWFMPVLAALSLALWAAGAFAVQQQAAAMRSVSARWPAGGVSPAQLESQLDIFREDGLKGAPELTLWTELPNQKLENGEDTTITCSLTQIFGQGEDVVSAGLLAGSFPARGDTKHCALSSTAAFELFGSANAMGQNLVWNSRTYTVQGIFKSDDFRMLAQADSASETKMPNMQLRFAGGGSRAQAEEFLARTDFGSGALLLDLPLLAWSLQTLAALPALLLGAWILIRLAARAWQKRKYPRLFLADLPLLLPLIAIDIHLTATQLTVPAALLPSGWSNFSFWSALPKSWHDNIAAWLNYPTGGDIDLLFTFLGAALVIFITLLLATLVLSRAKIKTAAQALAVSGCCIAWLFVLALCYANKGGLEVSIAMWLLPCLWTINEFALHAWGKEGPPDDKKESAAENAAPEE